MIAGIPCLGGIGELPGRVQDAVERGLQPFASSLHRANSRCCMSGPTWHEALCTVIP